MPPSDDAHAPGEAATDALPRRTVIREIEGLLSDVAAFAMLHPRR